MKRARLYSTIGRASPMIFINIKAFGLTHFSKRLRPALRVDAESTMIFQFGIIQEISVDR